MRSTSQKHLKWHSGRHCVSMVADKHGESWSCVRPTWMKCPEILQLKRHVPFFYWKGTFKHPLNIYFQKVSTLLPLWPKFKYLAILPVSRHRLPLSPWGVKRWSWTLECYTRFANATGESITAGAQRQSHRDIQWTHNRKMVKRVEAKMSYMLTLCLNMSVMILNDVFLRFINPRVKTALDFYSDLAALQRKGVAKHASIHLVKFYSTCLCRHMLCSRLNLSLIVLSLLSI